MYLGDGDTNTRVTWSYPKELQQEGKRTNIHNKMWQSQSCYTQWFLNRPIESMDEAVFTRQMLRKSTPD